MFDFLKEVLQTGSDRQSVPGISRDHRTYRHEPEPWSAVREVAMETEVLAAVF